MALVTQLARYVTTTIRDRGRSYYSSRRVSITQGDPWEVEANVRGSVLYKVSLLREEDTIYGACNCPYCTGNLMLCKHIWATVLAADEQGYLRGDGDNRNVKLMVDDEELYDDETEEDEDEDLDLLYGPLRTGAKKASPKPSRTAPPPPTWKDHLAKVKAFSPSEPEVAQSRKEVDFQLLYVLDCQATARENSFVVEVARSERKQNGDWGKPKSHSVSTKTAAAAPKAADRQILSYLVGAQTTGGPYYRSSYSYYEPTYSRFALSTALVESLVPLMCATGRFCLRLPDPTMDLVTLHWEEGDPWVLHLQMTMDWETRQYILSGHLIRGEERMSLDHPRLLHANGVLIYDDKVTRFDHGGGFGWIPLLCTQKQVVVPASESNELVKELLTLPHRPNLTLPPELQYDEVQPPMQPALKIHKNNYRWRSDRLLGQVSFIYEGESVPRSRAGKHIYLPPSVETGARHRVLLRDPEAERAAMVRLTSLGFKPSAYSVGELELAPRNLPRAVRELMQEGWHVEAEGKLYRKPGEFSLEVTSGIDWFELHGTVDFGDKVAQLPELLAALKKGDGSVVLDDGTFGVLPEEWLKQYGVLAGLGTEHDGHLRFTRSQVGLLDALLASQPQATCDELFRHAREELSRFSGIDALDPPSGFVGVLRGYQRDGLGWLCFLEKFGFGGCLADDMGLGKTVQVLALLESRREARATVPSGDNGGTQPVGPSLVVVPKSLVYNWIQEAARFAPRLRILDHTGVSRLKPGEHFEDYDIILTTYGTMRKDALEFKEVRFDYVILDEAQAIKNANTQSAKAVRLLRGQNRLAMSGTPIENHLGELWSLFEFLNPGMLGTASVLKLGGAGARNPSEETRALLGHALRPFILRRTKDQVAKDLPEKLEQTIYCELEPEQRKLYDELRDHYRQSLLDRVAAEGINKSKIQILEALLRLRQAACHPGLIDKAKIPEPSAKLDALLPQLEEVIEEGHKALVFSQFTSLLSIVRGQLDEQKITYEYLDGRTRDRGARVERFQTDPECRLFLVSLKAGGLGLNLTAAEYVFLLDPWWNPAVEAQAIDRTHRIGQEKPVFAYRLIARDTVEEKVLELQKSKRSLADAIITADNSLIRDLGREDLELLLS